MEADVVIPNQHNQFCVSGVSEHPVEAADVILPVLQHKEQHKHRLKQVSVQVFNKTRLPRDAHER